MSENKPYNIHIDCSEEEIFKQYIKMINAILSPAMRLTGIEIDVLDKILLIDYIYRNHTKEKRNKIIFNKITKERIRSEVYNISEASLNNVLMSLRSKGLITKTELVMQVPIKGGKIDINFKLQIK